MTDAPMAGRVAIVTGVSRREGIDQGGMQGVIDDLRAGWASPDLTESVRSALPSGRWGSPDDVSRLVLWLASDESAWITGQVLNSEGGFRRWRA